MEVTPEDLKFPKAVIARIVKDALPEGVNVSKEAKSAIGRSAAIFILHATSMANESAQSKKRKNLTADDILYAIRQLECSDLEKPVLEGLQLFQKKRTDRLQKRRVKAKQTDAVENGGPSNAVPNEDEIVELSDEDENMEEPDDQEQQRGSNDDEENGDGDDVIEIDEDD